MLMPVKSDPKLAVRPWLAWWTGFPGEVSEGRNLECRLIIPVIFMGLAGTQRLGNIFKSSYHKVEGASHKGLEPYFIGVADPLRHKQNVFI